MYPGNGGTTTSVYTGTGGGGAASQPDSSRVRDQLTTAEALLGQVHEAIGLLEKRLDTIVLPAPTQTPSAQPANKVIMSHMTDRLMQLNDLLNGAAARLQDLRNRIEL